MALSSHDVTGKGPREPAAVNGLIQWDLDLLAGVGVQDWDSRLLPETQGLTGLATILGLQVRPEFKLG